MARILRSVENRPNLAKYVHPEGLPKPIFVKNKAPTNGIRTKKSITTILQNLSKFDICLKYFSKMSLQFNNQKSYKSMTEKQREYHSDVQL